MTITTDAPDVATAEANAWDMNNAIETLARLFLADPRSVETTMNELGRRVRSTDFPPLRVETRLDPPSGPIWAKRIPLLWAGPQPVEYGPEVRFDVAPQLREMTPEQAVAIADGSPEAAALWRTAAEALGIEPAPSGYHFRVSFADYPPELVQVLICPACNAVAPEVSSIDVAESRRESGRIDFQERTVAWGSECGGDGETLFLRADCCGAAVRLPDGWKESLSTW